MDKEDRYGMFRNVMLLSATNVLVMALTVITKPVLARLVGPAEYGIFALTLGTANLLQGFILSFHQAGFDFYTPNAGKNARRLLYSELVAVVATLALLAVPLWLFFKPVSSLDDTQFLLVMAAAGIIAAMNIVTFFYRATEDFKRMSLIMAGFGLLSTIAVLAAGYFARSGLVAFAVRTYLVAGLVTVAAIIAIRYTGWALADIRRFFAYSLPLALSNIMTSLISMVDRYFLAAMVSISAVGSYDVAYTIATAGLGFSSALNHVLFPKMRRNIQKISDYASKSALVLTLLLSVLSLGLFYYSDIIVNLVLGAGYRGSEGIVKIICLSVPLTGIYGIMGSALLNLSKQKVVGLLVVFQAAVFILLNALLVPRFAGEGSALALLATTAAVTVAATAYFAVRQGCALRRTALVYALFLCAALPFFAFPQRFDFAVKTAAVLAFLAATFLLNRDVYFEALDGVKRISHGMRERLANFKLGYS